MLAERAGGIVNCDQESFSAGRMITPSGHLGQSQSLRDDLRRKIIWRSAGRADEISGDRCNGDRAAEWRALVDGGAAQENDGRVAEASLTLCAYPAFDACGGLAALAACPES